MDLAALTRERISGRGYVGASTRDIAQRVQMAEVTLFRQFANKESLYAEVLSSFSAIPILLELVLQPTGNIDDAPRVSHQNRDLIQFIHKVVLTGNEKNSESF
jgi:AcrR family transcriptional regulator